jgi:hypothetical protein
MTRRLRTVPLSLELKMCKCGRLKAKRGWRMIKTPVFDFIQRVLASNVKGLHITHETCGNCK